MLTDRRVLNVSVRTGLNQYDRLSVHFIDSLLRQGLCVEHRCMTVLVLCSSLHFKIIKISFSTRLIINLNVFNNFLSCLLLSVFRHKYLGHLFHLGPSHQWLLNCFYLTRTQFIYINLVNMIVSRRLLQVIDALLYFRFLILVLNHVDFHW